MNGIVEQGNRNIRAMFEPSSFNILEATARTISFESFKQLVYGLQEALLVKVERFGRGICHVQLLRCRVSLTVTHLPTFAPPAFEKMWISG